MTLLDSHAKIRMPVAFDNFNALDDTMKCVGSAGNFRLTRRHYKRPKTDNFVRGTYGCNGPILDAGQKPWEVGLGATSRFDCALRGSALGVCRSAGAKTRTIGSLIIDMTGHKVPRRGRRQGSIRRTSKTRRRKTSKTPGNNKPARGSSRP